MTILTQDRKTILSAKNFCFSIERTLSGKDKKFAIMNVPLTELSTTKTLGYYADEKSAVDELQAIFDAIERGDATYTIGEG